MSVIEKCTLELDGVFDRSAALRMADAIECVKPGGEVNLDLTYAREVHDVGLAMLAQTILRTGGSLRFRVRGLRARQHLLLRCLGIEPGAPSAGTALPAR